MVRVAIVGTGDFAHGLAHVFFNNNTQSSGNVLTVTKPGLKKADEEEPQYFHLTGVLVGDFVHTLQQADVIILGIPAYALPGFVQHYASLLHGKILVDPTNAWNKSDQDLNTSFLDGTSTIVGASAFRWVKAFNDVGAVDLLSRHAAQMKKPIASKMCSSDNEALEMVQNFAESSLGFGIKIVPFEHYAVLASHQAQVAGGDEWLSAIMTMVALFVVTQLYIILRYVCARTFLDGGLFVCCSLAMPCRCFPRNSQLFFLTSDSCISHLSLATTLAGACRIDPIPPFS
jgi:predicted dinucleotide-binding enzyme